MRVVVANGVGSWDAATALAAWFVLYRIPIDGGLVTHIGFSPPGE